MSDLRYIFNFKKAGSAFENLNLKKWQLCPSNTNVVGIESVQKTGKESLKTFDTVLSFAIHICEVLGST